MLIYSFIVTFAIGWVLHQTMGFTIAKDDEVSGIDLLEHAETAYDLASFGGSRAGTGGGGFVASRTQSVTTELTAELTAEPTTMELTTMEPTTKEEATR